MTHISRRHLMALLASTALAGCKSEGSSAGGSKSDSSPKTPDPAFWGDFDVQAYAGAPKVLKTQLGMNFLYHDDDGLGTWMTNGKSVGATMGRWPGGTITEFDPDFLANYIIDADKRNWAQFNDPKRGSLKRFLQGCSQNKIIPTIVLPTKRYIPRSGVIDYALARREVGTFIAQIFAGRFGSTRIPVWEIGNEFYVAPTIDAEDYAKIAMFIAQLIREHSTYKVEIGIQGGNWMRKGIYRIDAAVPDSKKSLFDFIITHHYPWNNSDAQMNHAEQFKALRRAWGNKPIYVSEWNTKNNPDLKSADTSIGMAQAGVMLRLFDDWVTMNVKYASFWALQHNTLTSAFYREQRRQSEGAYVAGKVFPWLSELLGQTRMNVIAAKTGQIGIWAYTSGSEVTILIAGYTSAKRNINIRLPWEPKTITGSRMFGSVGVGKYSPNVEQIFPAKNGRNLIIGINSRGPEEVMKIVIRK